MTTILGIKTNSGLEGVVIAADRQISIYDDDTGTIIGKEQTCKIIYGRDWIIGDAGGVSNQFAVFLRSEKGKMKKMICKAVQKYHQNSKKPHFTEINEINALAMRDGAAYDCLHEFILAAKVEEKAGLWHVDIFGNLKASEDGVNYIALGSGEDYVAGHMDSLSENGLINNNAIDIPAAIEAAAGCLEKAQLLDPNTGGLDLAVLSYAGVQYYGDFIQKNMKRQKEEMVAKIKENYR